jgi:hypothetical protein
MSSIILGDLATGQTQFWYKDGKYHREDGPAIEDLSVPSGALPYKAWYKNGKHHRVGGPAIEYSSGTKEWWLNGKPHREDGPAIIASYRIAWYYHGKEIHCETQEEFDRLIKLAAFW